MVLTTRNGEFSPYEVIGSLRPLSSSDWTVTEASFDTGGLSFETLPQQETASLLPTHVPRTHKLQLIIFGTMFGTIFYILINIILTSLTAFLATLYILIGHIILHALPQLTLDIPLLIIYAKVGLAGGLVLGALASFITSTWLAICCILLLWKTREEVNEFRKGFSLAFLGPYRTNGTTSTATTTPPANHATSANLGVQEAQEPTTPTPTSKVDRAKETMSWTVAGSVGVYVLQVYYDKFSPAESVDVKVLVDPIQAGLAAGLGRLVGDTFYRALRPVQRPTAPARDDSSDGPK